MTREEEIEQTEAEIVAASGAIKKLLSKTQSSVSFGDQSFSLMDVEKLMKVRDRLRSHLASLRGRNRRTIKVHFPSC